MRRRGASVYFRRSIRVKEALSDALDPTAKQLVVLVHDTLFSLLYGAPFGLALGTVAQLVPFQRSTSVSIVRALLFQISTPPAAKQLVVLVHDTPCSLLLTLVALGRLGLGLGTIAHLVPFHRSTSVTVAPTLFAYSSPTAKQLVGLVHDTSDSPLPYVASGGLGLGTIAQPVPFQCS